MQKSQEVSRKEIGGAKAQSLYFSLRLKFHFAPLLEKNKRNSTAKNKEAKPTKVIAPLRLCRVTFCLCMKK
jgi:hypothetical protein